MRAAAHRAVITARLLAGRALWLVPVLLLLLGWALLPVLVDLPAYQLPRLAEVAATGWRLLVDGTLAQAIGASLLRLAVAFLIGAGLGLLLGLSMAASRVLTLLLEPIVAFFQAVAGIAWIPLAIVWFGFGDGPVLFVVANAIFFIVLYNTLLGVHGIQRVLPQAVRTLGGTRWQVLREVLLPGAMVSVLAGLRTGLAFGWRALVAVELIAANSGMGFLTLSASRNYQSEVVVVAIVVVGLLWLAMDRLLLRPIERRTVVRWGMVRKTR
ncbi:ABC transporter permease [Crossiella sp. CA198]|uniref:ABC transporter permease n=1 Tax=Crossiella sp. CA198 TaxID=3455607 RepID=UPI003F8D3C38